jgi:hypothetical protein
VKRLVKLVLAAAVVGAVLVVLKRRPAPPSASPTAPPYPVNPTAAPVVPEPDPWVEPTPDGACPDGYPVKAKLSSRIFHVPEGALYERTTADRCYASPEAAEADGLRASKR